MNRTSLLALALSLSPAALADDWQITLTADNAFRLYLGTSSQTTLLVGDGSYWAWPGNYTVTGDSYVYVVAVSDRAGYQGLLGVFDNRTSHRTILTGNSSWEVFPAGAYAATNPYAPNEWPANVWPTQAQIDAAISWANHNDHWVPAVTVPGYINGCQPWGTISGIPSEAAWIWHDSGRNGPPPSPLVGSFNHDEYLIFRALGGSTCYANCDNSTTAPILNVADFSCFLNHFAAGDTYANCDTSTTAPVLNVADFSCFLNRFAGGCN
jgi:hypothetical protein